MCIRDSSKVGATDKSTSSGKKATNVNSAKRQPPSVVNREKQLKEKEDRKMRLLQAQKRTKQTKSQKTKVVSVQGATATKEATAQGVRLTRSSSNHLARRQVQKSNPSPESGSPPKLTFKLSSKEPTPVLRKRSTRSTSNEGTGSAQGVTGSAQSSAPSAQSSAIPAQRSTKRKSVRFKM